MTPRERRFFRWELIILLGVVGAAVVGTSIALGSFFEGLLVVLRVLLVVLLVVFALAVPLLVRSARRRRRQP